MCTYIQGISDRLSGTEDDCNVGWLTANQRPIKDILNTLVSKWKAVYAGYLERQVYTLCNRRKKRAGGRESCRMLLVIAHNIAYGCTLVHGSTVCMQPWVLYV